jgi:hypothetical protein
MHIRKWCIIRIELPELPEVGISVADNKLAAEGQQINFFYDKAIAAFERIVDKNSQIKEGSSGFVRSFIDIARGKLLCYFFICLFVSYLIHSFAPLLSILLLLINIQRAIK